MEKTKLIIFNKENVEELLREFDFKFSLEEEGNAIIDSKGEIVGCETCKVNLTTDKVGNIAYGSRKIFCDNPVCFATWVVENKIK